MPENFSPQAHSSTYIVGQYYNASTGVTQQDFEDENKYNLSVPVEEGFLSCPELTATAIIVVNLSGQDVVANCTKPKPKASGTVQNYRENQFEIGSFILPRGQAGHFQVDPSKTIVSISAVTNTASGQTKPLTGFGYMLSDLEDTQLVVKTASAKEGGAKVLKIDNANLNQYCTILNSANIHVAVTVRKSATAFSAQFDDQNQLKQDRKPDLGDEPQCTKILEPRGQLHLDSPPDTYFIRALQTNSETVPEEDEFFTQGSQIPSASDYVLLTDSQLSAIAGQTVVFLASLQEGDVTAAVYDNEQLKFVTPKIVVTDQ